MITKSNKFLIDNIIIYKNDNLLIDKYCNIYNNDRFLLIFNDKYLDTDLIKKKLIFTLGYTKKYSLIEIYEIINTFIVDNNLKNLPRYENLSIKFIKSFKLIYLITGHKIPIKKIIDTNYINDKDRDIIDKLSRYPHFKCVYDIQIDNYGNLYVDNKNNNLNINGYYSEYKTLINFKLRDEFIKTNLSTNLFVGCEYYEIIKKINDTTDNFNYSNKINELENNYKNLENKINTITKQLFTIISRNNEYIRSNRIFNEKLLLEKTKIFNDTIDKFNERLKVIENRW
jgi:hypothetical protein